MYPSTATEQPHVLLVGAGALGCAAARGLASTGAAALTLVDDDLVEPSNLQRQVLYDGGDLGRLKVEAAAERLRADHGATVRGAAARVEPGNVASFLEGADVVLDCCDDPATKFLLSDACVAASVPLVYGGVARTGGQWMLILPGRSACLTCAFPQRGDETAEGCSALGILAPVAGLVGSMQALSALAFLQSPERVHAGRLFVYELASARMRHVDFPASPRCRCRQQAPTLEVPDPVRRQAT